MVVQNLFNPVLQSYSPKNVVVTIGVFLMTQWNKVTVSYDAPLWEFKVGCYGKTVRTKVNNPLGTITIELPQTSAGNAYNSAYLNALDTELNIDSITPVFITDLWGGSLHVMIRGSITQIPDSVYDANPVNRSWVIRGDMDVNVLSARNAINSFGSIVQ